MDEVICRIGYNIATNANAGKEIGSHLSYFLVLASDYVQLFFKMHHKQHPGQFEGLTYVNTKSFRDWTLKDFFKLLKKTTPENDTTVRRIGKVIKVYEIKSGYP